MAAFISYSELIQIGRRVLLNYTPAIFGTIEATPLGTVIEAVVNASYRFSFISEVNGNDGFVVGIGGLI